MTFRVIEFIESVICRRRDCAPFSADIDDINIGWSCVRSRICAIPTFPASHLESPAFAGDGYFEAAVARLSYSVIGALKKVKQGAGPGFRLSLRRDARGVTANRRKQQ